AIAATSPSCLPTTSRCSLSSASAAKMPVSADPGFVKRYSTPASLSVWRSSIPPVPVMVLRMMSLALVSRGLKTPALYQGVPLSEHGNQAVHHCRLAEDRAQDAAAIGRREVPDDRVAPSGLLDQDLARGQVPDLVVHVHHRVARFHDDGRVGVGGPIDSMV